MSWQAVQYSSHGVLEGKACCAVEQFLCQSDEDCVCSHIQTPAESQAATQTLFLRLPSVLPSLFLLSAIVIFWSCSPVPCLSPASSLSFALHCSSSLPLSLCFPSEWYRRSALRPHSSLWQPQLPDKRKQIPPQQPDINGLSCIFLVLPFSFVGWCSYVRIHTHTHTHTHTVANHVFYTWAFNTMLQQLNILWITSPWHWGIME